MNDKSKKTTHTKRHVRMMMRTNECHENHANRGRGRRCRYCHNVDIVTIKEQTPRTRQFDTILVPTP
jgi:hypothetical protein